MNATVASVLAPGRDWFRAYGLFACADALTAGFVAPQDAAAMVAARFNDSVTICGLSPFNTYFVLQALAAAGELDRGLATVQQCWGVYLRLGATTTWEIAKPGWVDLLSPTDTLPGFAGYTSQAHPWSSGATAWASANVAGVRPLSPGFSTYTVAPHLGGGMRGVSARVPVGSGGAISVQVGALGWGAAANATRAHGAAGASASAGAAAYLCVGVPQSLRVSRGTLQVSQVLAERLTGVVGGEGVRISAHFSPSTSSSESPPEQEEACACGAQLGGGEAVATPLAFDGGEVGPVGGDGRRSRVAVLPLWGGGGGCHRFTLWVQGGAEGSPPPPPPPPAAQPGRAAAASAAPPNPFPVPFYPANFLGRDEVTSGTWRGTYGSAGYYLVDFDGPKLPVQALPPWVQSAQLNGDDDPLQGPWLEPPPDSDPRALQDPRNASSSSLRRIGQFCSNQCCPTFSFNVRVTPPQEGRTHQFAFYFVDYDARGRRQTVQLMDLDSLNDISPPVLVGPDFTGGVWLVWQYAGSIRIRMNGIRGDNAVLSAVLFDEVPALGSPLPARAVAKGGEESN